MEIDVTPESLKSYFYFMSKNGNIIPPRQASTCKLVFFYLANLDNSSMLSITIWAYYGAEPIIQMVFLSTKGRAYFLPNT